MANPLLEARKCPQSVSRQSSMIRPHPSTHWPSYSMNSDFLTYRDSTYQRTPALPAYRGFGGRLRPYSDHRLVLVGFFWGTIRRKRVIIFISASTLVSKKHASSKVPNSISVSDFGWTNRIHYRRSMSFCRFHRTSAASPPQVPYCAHTSIPDRHSVFEGIC